MRRSYHESKRWCQFQFGYARFDWDKHPTAVGKLLRENMDTDEWQYIQLGREEITNEVFSKLKEKRSILSTLKIRAGWRAEYNCTYYTRKTTAVCTATGKGK